MFKFLLLLFLPLSLIAQTDKKTIEGQVKNTRNELIPNATIKVLSSDTTGYIIGFAFSDKEGKFSLSIANNPSKLFLQISIISYETLNVLITDSILNSNNLFTLYPVSKELPEVHIIADRGITKRGDTTSYRVSAFSKGNEENIADLMKKLPGFRLDELGNLTFNGKTISAVLVEDDDLFGRSYSKLINNASINGIEKVEVIENYKNLNKLESSLSNSKQTVVNLKYKKNGLKNFGEIKAGYSPNLDLIDSKLNNTTLSKKFKAITIASKNQIGFLAEQQFGFNNENIFSKTFNSDFPTSLEPISTFLSIANIEPININSNRIFNNNSDLFSTNFLIKPSKNIIFKSSYSYLMDNFNQSYENTTSYLNSVISSSLKQNNFLEKKNNYTLFDGEFSLNWSSKQQTRINFANAQSNNNHFSNGFFQLTDVNQVISNNKKLINAQLLHTILINSNSYFNLKYSIQTNSENSLFSFTNPLEDSIFGINNTTQKIQQNTLFSQRSSYLGLTYLKKQDKFDFVLSYFKINREFTPTNNTFGIGISNIYKPLSKDFSSQQLIKFSENTLIVNLIKEINRNLKLDFSTKLKSVNYLIDTNQTKNNTNQFFLLPSISLGWNLKDNQMITLNASINAELPRLEQLNNNISFSGINSINKGTSIVNLQKGFELEINYFLHDPTEKKIIINIGATYKKTPNIYNYNFFSRDWYAFNYLVPFENSNNNCFNFTFDIDKNLSSIKSWLKLKVFSNLNLGYSNTQNVLTYNRSFGFQSELKFSTNWNKFLNFSTSVRYSSNESKSKTSENFSNRFFNYDVLSNSTIEFKIFKKIFFDFQFDYLLNKSFNQQSQNVQFLDIKCRYTLTKKLSSYILLRNVLNNKTFITNSLTNTQNIVQKFELMPMIALISFGYKF